MKHFSSLLLGMALNSFHIRDPRLPTTFDEAFGITPYSPPNRKRYDSLSPEAFQQLLAKQALELTLKKEKKRTAKELHDKAQAVIKERRKAKKKEKQAC